MAPRPGEIHQISEKLGELTAYVHEHRHGVANVSQKIDALSRQLAKEMAGIEERMRVRFEAVEARLVLLERARQREEGAKSLLAWVLQSPLLAWVAAAIVMVAAWWKGRP